MISKDIIERCKRKDQKAFKLCYEACAPYVFSIIKNYISNDDYRRDAMQEVFSQIFQSLDSYNNNKGAFKSWVAQITVFNCISLLRKRKKLLLIVPLGDEVTASHCDELLDPLTKEDLDALLSQMPVGYKTVFLLKVIDGYPHREIAELLGISILTSRSQLYRAIAWIQKNLNVETKNFIYG